jgi:hypothetical protein
VSQNIIILNTNTEYIFYNILTKMSFLDSRDRGLPYGAIPYTELLNKLEETDTNQESDDHHINYLNYLRDEIVDRSLDKPFLESDQKRQSDMSKNIINLRYNGSRGEYENPKHPDLFVGFMDHDPRALDNNPRMDQYNNQIKTRMPNLEVRMGKNSTDTDHQSPWTNQSINTCRKEIHKSLSNNTKIFVNERDGRATNRNVLSEYDHNKKQLIYKDIVPSSLDVENFSGKTNTKYNHTNFTNNEDFNVVDFGDPTNAKYGNLKVNKFTDVEHSHVQKDELLNKPTLHPRMQTDVSKITNTNYDGQYSEHLDNRPAQKFLMKDKYVNNNTLNEYIFNEEFNIFNTKTGFSGNITNPRLINNDVSMSDHDVNILRKNDKLVTRNTVTNLSQSIPVSIQSENLQKKHNTIFENGQIVSNFDINTTRFSNVGPTKMTPLPSKSDIDKVEYTQLLHNQDQNMIKSNGFKFTDDISNYMLYNVSEVSDQTRQNTTGKQTRPEQEHKVVNSNTETVWTTSDENVTGKRQQHSRTSGTEDQSVIDLPKTHDHHISNSSGIIGSKSIRGDYMPNTDIRDSNNLPNYFSD